MTAQAHEKLIIEGAKTSMAFCPPIPTDHPLIRVLTAEEFREGCRAHRFDSMVGTTACWRGYVGTWELKAGRLYLKRVTGRFLYEGDEPIFAYWVTAVLRIPEGEQLQYVHMGFGSVYEYERHIKIENGLVVAERIIDTRDRAEGGRFGLGSDADLPGGYNHFLGDDW